MSRIFPYKINTFIHKNLVSVGLQGTTAFKSLTNNTFNNIYDRVGIGGGAFFFGETVLSDALQDKVKKMFV
jgi:hypothetical protein